MKKNHRGRPRTNLRIWELMKKHGCSRTWAYVLLRREKIHATPDLHLGTKY